MKIEKQSQTKAEKIAAWREHIPDLHNGSYRRKYDKAIERARQIGKRKSAKRQGAVFCEKFKQIRAGK